MSQSDQLWQSYSHILDIMFYMYTDLAMWISPLPRPLTPLSLHDSFTAVSGTEKNNLEKAVKYQELLKFAGVLRPGSQSSVSWWQKQRHESFNPVLFTASFGLSDHISTTEKTEVHVCTGEKMRYFKPANTSQLI